MFNQDSLYKGYEKRLNKLPKAQGTEPAAMDQDQAHINYGSAARPSDSALERMAGELKDRQEGELDPQNDDDDDDDDSISQILICFPFFPLFQLVQSSAGGGKNTIRKM